MDPISITTGVLALVGNAIKLFNLVNTYSNTFQRTELNLQLLSTECKTLQLALGNIDKLYTGKSASIGIDSRVRLVLADCEEKFKSLLKKLQPFVEPVGSSRPNGMNIRDRISATLKAKDIDFYRQCIQEEVQLVNMLLKTLEYQPPMKNRESVDGSQKLQELLKKSQRDTKSLRTMNERDKSMFYAGASSTKDLGSTTGADVDSVIGDEEFQFDEELINTPAYRRAFKSRQRIISGQGQAGSATSSTSPTLQSSAKGSSSTGLSQFFRKAMKIEDSGGSSSLAKTVVADSIIVEPSDEIIARDDDVLTDVDIRDTKAKFYELMALHREILAMKFADKSYNNILQEKIQRREDILLHLQVTVMNWRLQPEIIQPGLTGEEFEAVERTAYSLVSLGTSVLSGR